MSTLQVFIISLAFFATMASARPGLLAVLYSYPTDNGGAIWTAVKDAKISNPDLPVIIIANPSSGPGTAVEEPYVTAVDEVVALGIKAIGYVDTNYGTIGISTVKSNMDKYVEWYPNITGFFLDQMRNEAGSEDYYTEITSYAVQLNRGFTMGNPGTASIASYIETVNNSVIYETQPLPTPQTLNLGYAIDRCSLIAYNVPAAQINQSYISEVAQYVQWIWVTDDILPNPYDTNPSYFQSLVQFIVAAGASPANPTTPESTATYSTLSTALSALLFCLVICFF
jgi:hypothetical protein